MKVFVPQTPLRAPLKIHFLLRLAAKSAILRYAQSPNHSGFASLSLLFLRVRDISLRLNLL
jgi:hypothetical protein